MDFINLLSPFYINGYIDLNASKPRKRSDKTILNTVRAEEQNLVNFVETETNVALKFFREVAGQTLERILAPETWSKLQMLAKASKQVPQLERALRINGLNALDIGVITYLLHRQIQDGVDILSKRFDLDERQPNEISISSFASPPSKLIEQLSFYIQLCRLAYNTHERNLRQTLPHLRGCEDMKVIFCEVASLERMPAHFVCVSESRKEMCVVLRGTNCADDIITDLNYTPQSLMIEGLQTHFVHGGIASDTACLYERLLPTVELARIGGLQLTFTGHSLGAGAAALLAISFRKNGFDNVRAYAFAPPACANAALREMSLQRISDEDDSELVITVVHGDDLVPRATPSAALELLANILSLDWSQVRKWVRSVNIADRIVLTPIIERLDRKVKDALSEFQDQNLLNVNDAQARHRVLAAAWFRRKQKALGYENQHLLDMVLPGRVVSIFNRSDSVETKPMAYDRCFRATRHLKISASAADDHSVKRYDSALQTLADYSIWIARWNKKTLRKSQLWPRSRRISQMMRLPRLSVLNPNLPSRRKTHALITERIVE